MRMIATGELKNCLTRTGILEVVVGKLCHREKLCLVILLLIYENTKVSFHGAVLLFFLIVCLRVIWGRELSLDAEEVTERGPKLGHKNCFPVTYDGVWKTVMSYHHVYDYFRLPLSIGGNFD